MRIILFTVVLLLMLASPLLASKSAPIKIRSDKKKTALIKTSRHKKISNSDLNCLARNIYFEARGEGIMGQIAIGLVTLERTESENFPSTVCEVVRADSAFSWTLYPHKVKNQEAFDQAKVVANIALIIRGMGLDFLQADHFHSVKLTRYPRWSYHFEQVAIIGNHVFYRSDS